MRPKTLSPEHRANIAAALRGRVFSDETRAKMSAAWKNRVVTDATKAKISAAGLGRVVLPGARQKLSDAKRQGDQRFWSKVNKTSNCWEWTGYRQKIGYGSIGVGSRLDGTKRAILAHRFSYELHFGPISDGLKVLHTCDNRACVRPDHLWLGTQLDNVRDMIQKGRANRRPSQKLT